MNILTHALPESVEVNGRRYPINTDFRAALLVMMAFEDSEIAGQEKQGLLLRNMYPKIPDDQQEAMRQALTFLNCGKDEDEGSGQPRVYSFTKDAERIYAAFRQVHGVDLATANLHWWQFVPLFQAVIADQNNAFGSLVLLRLRVKTGKATEAEQKAAHELGDLMEIEEIDNRTLEEREALERFNQLVEAGMKNRGKNGG